MSEKLAALELVKLIAESEVGQGFEKNRRYWFELYAQCNEVVRQSHGVALSAPIDKALRDFESRIAKHPDESDQAAK